ncbi:MAG: cellulose synthase complex periplasmic endoglucanase BcsZ [Gallionella sp.]|nr:cellulose synthase complex periplasmic endoglucanase BcsZ [Gallionella sp.]
MSYTRRHFIKSSAAMFCSVLAGCALEGNAAGLSGCAGWPAWDTFKQDFVQEDGRVIDTRMGGSTTSEGQAYALFFALVADDRKHFDVILDWTRNNLAGGDFTARLMAWKWGERPDHSWGVLDEHAASDADIWLAYTLYQASNHWHEPKLGALAELLQARIAKELVVDVAGVGPVLLPGPQGYSLSSGAYKLNPSYQPLFLLAGLAHQVKQGPWAALAKSTMDMFAATTPAALAADWVVVKPKQGFVIDANVGLQGGYEAIRVYLWAGMLSSHDPRRAILLRHLAGMRAAIKRDMLPPEKIDVTDGKVSGAGPVGFSAAVLPILSAWGDQQSVHLQQTRIVAMGGIPKVYYERALGLFAQGWMEQRYRFESNGSLVLKKVAQCTK